MTGKTGIVLTSPKPFENGLAFWDKGYVLFGGLAFIIGFLNNGLTGGSVLMLLAIFLCWVVKANVALIKWRKLRAYEFVLARQLPLEELAGKLVESLTPYGLRVDIVNQRPSVSYRNVKIQVCYNENGTFSMPWSQSPGWFFLDSRYIASYHNTVAIMSIVGYHVQKLCAAETGGIQQNAAVNTDGGAGTAPYADNALPLLEKKRKKPTVVVLMIAAALVLAAIGLFSSEDNNSYINAVKEGHPNAYEEMTYGEAFHQFFANPKWTYFKSSEGLDIVEFSGDCTYLESDVRVTLQFTLEAEGENLEVTYCDMNGVPQNQLFTAALITKVFDDSLGSKEKVLLTEEFEEGVATETQERLLTEAGAEPEAELEPETEPETQPESDTESATEPETEPEETMMAELASEYIFFDSNSRLLKEDEMNGLSNEELRLAVNEIYARHGRKFSDSGLQEYFNSKSWYQGTIEPNQFSEAVLNDFEKENARKLSEKRNAVQSASLKPQSVYGLYECSSNTLHAELEAGIYTDDEAEYIRLTGSSPDGSGYGEFYGIVVSTKDGNYTAVDESGNVVDVYFDGTGKAHVSDENLLGEGAFPGFTGTYNKTADFSNAG